MQTCATSFSRVLPVILFLAVGETQGQSVNEIAESCIRASGGYDHLTAVKNVQRTGRVKLNAAGQEMIGGTTVIIVPWQKAYLHTDLNFFAQKQGWNGEKGWEDGAQGLRDLREDEIGLLRLQTVLNPLVGYQMLELMGSKITREAGEKIGGEEHDVLAFGTDKDTKIRFYISQQTHLLSRILVAHNPAGSSLVIEIMLDFSDYQSFGQIKLPCKTHIAVGQALSYETVFTDTKLDVDVAERLFEKPGSLPPEPSPTTGETVKKRLPFNP